jgi:hypothetical protein
LNDNNNRSAGNTPLEEDLVLTLEVSFPSHEGLTKPSFYRGGDANGL